MTYEEFQKLYNEDAEFKSLIDEKSKAKSKAIDNIAAKQVENIIADINTSDNEFLQKPMQEPKAEEQNQEIKQAQTPMQEPLEIENIAEEPKNYDNYYNELSKKYNISIGDLRNLHKENDYKDLEKIPGLLDNAVLEQGNNNFKPIKEVLFSEVGRVRQSTNNQEFYGLNQNETKKILDNLSSNYEVDESEVIQLYNNYVEKKVLNEQKYLGVKDFLKEQNNIDEDEVQDIRAKTDLVVQETFKDFVNIGNAFLNDDKSSINELNEKKRKIYTNAIATFTR